MMVDPVADKIPFVSVVEIFETGGKTPPHHHRAAHEMFYVLSGSGRAHCGGKTYEMAKGDTLVLPPGAEHVVENTGPRKALLSHRDGTQRGVRRDGPQRRDDGARR